MGVEVSRLSNGLTVATETLPSTESVALGVWVKSGARNERLIGIAGKRFDVLARRQRPVARNEGIVNPVQRLAGGNVAVALLSALVVLPPILVWADERGWVHRSGDETTAGAPPEQTRPRRDRPLRAR